MAKKKRTKILIWGAVGLFVALAGLEIAGRLVERHQQRAPLAMGGVGPAAPAKSAKEIAARNAQLLARMKALAPWGIYIVVDTAANRLYLLQDQKIIKEVVVSCGSGDVLEETAGTRKWIFDTPRGEFSVTSKLVNPTWIKPDWAFIEEGEKPPTKFDDRIDNDSLGDYALGFGDGFFIHGTLYTRLLGRNVTHGCVRVGDKDLKDVFQTVPLGAKIYIY
jgi:lipoprotein-anchoring transpeptidase ErfK/SrfK